MAIGKVAFTRWFSDGEGWAYDKSLGPELIKVIFAVDPLLKGPLTAAGKLYHFEEGGKHYYAIRKPDNHCEDQLAINRQPSETTVVQFDQPVSPALEEKLKIALEGLRMPATRAGLALAQIRIDGNTIEPLTSYEPKRTSLSPG